MKFQTGCDTTQQNNIKWKIKTKKHFFLHFPPNVDKELYRTQFSIHVGNCQGYRMTNTVNITIGMYNLFAVVPSCPFPNVIHVNTGLARPAPPHCDISLFTADAPAHAPVVAMATSLRSPWTPGSGQRASQESNLFTRVYSSQNRLHIPKSCLWTPCLSGSEALTTPLTWYRLDSVTHRLGLSVSAD